MALGHVGDIGEPVPAGVPFDRLSTTTNPYRHGIPIKMMEDALVRRRARLDILWHPHNETDEGDADLQASEVPPSRSASP
jgi:hypothetical protein